MSYQGLISGAHSLSGVYCASSSLDWSDSEYTASSPTSRVVGGSKIAFFPLRWEELWLFTGVMVQEFDRRKRMGMFKEEEVVKKGEMEREFWEGRRSLCLDYKGIPS